MQCAPCLWCQQTWHNVQWVVVQQWFAEKKSLIKNTFSAAARFCSFAAAAASLLALSNTWVCTLLVCSK